LTQNRDVCVLTHNSARRSVGTMVRSDWLMLFLAADPGHALDPVRVQKGMFLLAMRTSLDDAERYDFEPYAYGPMSRGLYGDMRLLCRERLLDMTPIEGASWQLLQLSSRGARRAIDLARHAEREQPDVLAQLTAIRREIDGLSFAELLEHVYDRYPEYAVRSVFRRPR
jgi:hypothetical protein